MELIHTVRDEEMGITATVSRFPENSKFAGKYSVLVRDDDSGGVYSSVIYPDREWAIRKANELNG